jgi:DNA-binding transcriptional LysR family regulator
VAEAANITRAAERLFLAQPSLSKQIKDLEDEIGFPIFIRNREGVQITPAGQMIIAYAQEALLARTKIISMAHAVHLGEVPPFRLGFSSFINPNLLQLFRGAYIRRADEGTLSRLLVETSILLAASRSNPATVLRDAASAYKVDTEAITLKVKQEFATKEKAKKAAQPTAKTAKKAA